MVTLLLPRTQIPSLLLPATTLRSKVSETPSAFVPIRMLVATACTATPASTFGIAVKPVASVPSRLPATTVPVVPMSGIRTPSHPLPDTKLPSAASPTPSPFVPTIVPVETLTQTPEVVLPIAAVPDALVPT